LREIWIGRLDDTSDAGSRIDIKTKRTVWADVGLPNDRVDLEVPRGGNWMFSVRV
jgi:hypothetical protein